MSHGTYFVQECPTCGRRLHVRVEYLGRKVVCQHCRGQFFACDPASDRYPQGNSADALLRRVDELLKCVSECEARARPMRPR
jgi:hypothetical protein